MPVLAHMSGQPLRLLPWPRQVAWPAGADGAPRLLLAPPLALRARGDVPVAWRADFARQWLQRTGRVVVEGGDGIPFDVCVHGPPSPLPGLDADESSAIRIDAGGVRIDAASRFGLRHGGAALLQLVARDGGQPWLPCIAISDAPRFPWRGLMLDVARRFLPLPDLLRVLDGMAASRLNVLHLHLTDDQAFRFPSTTYPRLAGHGSGGVHYTPAQLQHLVGRAAELGIRVVPELDMPGHCASWLAGHPELSARPGGSGPRQAFGVSDLALDPTREATYAFVAGLLRDVAALFPDPFVHIGGDEVHADAWQAHAPVAAYMRAHGFADQRALQAHFTRRVAAMLAQLGRRAVVWDEALDDALPAGVVVQAWRGVAALARARAAGRDVVLSAPYYLDLNHGAGTHYGFDPEAPIDELLRREDAIAAAPGYGQVAAAYRRFVAGTRALPPVTAAARPGRVLGGEACMWSELSDAATLDARVFSRLPAVAERLWSPATVDDAEDLHRRLEAHLEGLSLHHGIVVRDACARHLAVLGVPADVVPALAGVLAWLEPVKWYARHLGTQGLAARADDGDGVAGGAADTVRGGGAGHASGPEEQGDAPGRPYDALTPLDRIVDHLPPESLPARAFARALAARPRPPAAVQPALATAGVTLLSQVAPLRRGPALLSPLRQVRQLDEVAPLVDDLALLAARLPDVLDGRDPGGAWLDAACATVHGDLFVPAAHVLRAWLRGDMA
jgi:hexosaminidase